MTSLGFERRVVVGGQAEIDAGHVVAVQWSHILGTDGHVFPDSSMPGEGSTVWLAAHRTTLGSTFNRLPELEAGDLVEIDHGGRRFVYHIDRNTIVPTRSPSTVIAGDLVLQCSWVNNQTVLVYGHLAAVVEP